MVFPVTCQVTLIPHTLFILVPSLILLCLTLPMGTDSRQCQSCDLPPYHLEVTFLSLPSQGQGAQLCLTHVIYHPSSPPLVTPKHTTNLTKRKRTSYLCHLLLWSGSGNIQDRHIAFILKYRGISRHTEGCVGIIQIGRLWHKSYNLASI